MGLPEGLQEGFAMRNPLALPGLPQAEVCAFGAASWAKTAGYRPMEAVPAGARRKRAGCGIGA